MAISKQPIRTVLAPAREQVRVVDVVTSYSLT